jgi:hypothetical protein
MNTAATAGAETTLLDLRELALPMYKPDVLEMVDFAQRVARVDIRVGVVLGSELGGETFCPSPFCV